MAGMNNKRISHVLLNGWSSLTDIRVIYLRTFHHKDKFPKNVKNANPKAYL